MLVVVLVIGLWFVLEVGERPPAIDGTSHHAIVWVRSLASPTQQPDLTAMGIGLADGIARHLSSAQSIQAVTDGEMRELIRGLGLEKEDVSHMEVLRRIVDFSGVSYVVVGDFLVGADKLRINIRLVRAGSVKPPESCAIEGADRAMVELDVAKALGEHLGFNVPGMLSATHGAEPLGPTAEDMAVQLFEKGEFTSAYDAYCRASDQDLNNIQLHRRIEECARRSNLQAAYLERYKTLVDANPKSAILHNYLANGYLMIDPEDGQGKAREQYDRALSLDPAFSPPLNNLAIISHRQGDDELAEELFKRYLAVCPEDAVTWVNLGLLHVYRLKHAPGQEQTIKEARNAFEKALELQPSLPSI